MLRFEVLSHASFSKLLLKHTVNVEKINVLEMTRSISNTFTKQQVAQTVADDSAKHDGRPAIFIEGSLPVGRLCVMITNQLFIVESSDNEQHFLHAANQKRSTNETMLRGTIRVVSSGFRRIQCVNSTLGNNNGVNLNNTSPGNNIQRNVHVSRNEANHNNLINVQSNKCALPTIINTNFRGALACKVDEIKIIKDNYGVGVLAVTETWYTSRIPDGSLSLPGFNLYRRDMQDGRQRGGLFAMNEIQSRLSTEQN